MDWRTAGWSNPECRISKYFTVREALWLHKWGRMATEKDGVTDHVKEQICRMAEKMDAVREFIGLPIIVDSWFRSVLYNMEKAAGKPHSRHMCLGPWSAVDWYANLPGAYDRETSCQKLKAKLLSKLQEWDLRMERNDGGLWVHLDNGPVLYTRYFKP